MKILLDLSKKETEKLLWMLGSADVGESGSGWQSDELMALEKKVEKQIAEAGESDCLCDYEGTANGG